MRRYRVISQPSAEDAVSWDAYLGDHTAEVVLAGGFAGADIVHSGERRLSDYVASEDRLEAYLADRAPALRAEAEALFPNVARTRETDKLHLRVSAPFEWAALGVVDAFGAAVPCPSDGPFRLGYFAPWCADCVDGWETSLAAGSSDPRAALVAVYANAEEIETFLKLRPSSLPVWREPSARGEPNRVRTFHGVLRQLTGDGRKWGLPIMHRLLVKSGRFVVCSPG